jgi:exopolyphosphatase/guanosine-5'-triphosphate,3'-diphosphate pyrophosphatase
VELGVVRLTERLLANDPPTPEQITRAREWIRRETLQVQTILGDLRGATLIGTAGSITTLAAMAQKLSAYEPIRIHNYRLGLDTVEELERDILSRTKAQRRNLPGLEAGREEVIAAGAIILREVMVTLGFQQVLVSDFGLREGVLLHLAQHLRSGR